MQRVPRCALRHHRGRRHLAGAGVGRAWIRRVGLVGRRLGLQHRHGHARSRRGRPASRVHGRAYSDISADADPNTGIQIYDSSPLPQDTTPAGWVVAGGTSVSAPLVAAYYALDRVRRRAWERRRDDRELRMAVRQLPQAQTDPDVTRLQRLVSGASFCNGPSRLRRPDGRGQHLGRGTEPGAPGIGGPGPTGTYTRASPRPRPSCRAACIRTANRRRTGGSTAPPPPTARPRPTSRPAPAPPRSRSRAR